MQCLVDGFWSGIGGVDVWRVGAASSGKLFVPPLNIVDSACSAFVCRPGCVLACSCSCLNASTKFPAILFVSSIGLSTGMLQYWGCKLYCPEILTPPVDNTWFPFRSNVSGV